MGAVPKVEGLGLRDLAGLDALRQLYPLSPTTRGLEFRIEFRIEFRVEFRIEFTRLSLGLSLELSLGLSLHG